MPKKLPDNVVARQHPAYTIAGEVLCLCGPGQPNRGKGNSLALIAADLGIQRQTVIKRIEDTPLPTWAAERLQGYDPWEKQEDRTPPVYIRLMQIFHAQTTMGKVPSNIPDGICWEPACVSLARAVAEWYWQMVYEADVAMRTDATAAGGESTGPFERGPRPVRSAP